MIKNIVFDVGKVLVTYEPDACMIELGFDQKTRDAINAAVFRNPIWDESDRGVLSPEELLDCFIANAPEYAKEIRLARDSADRMHDLLPYAVDWVKSLKERGYHLYILSNYSKFAQEACAYKMEFLPYMDGVVFSYQCKMIKPEPDIYQYLLDTYHLNPEECVFLDDRQVNIEAARQAGMHGILFQNYEQGSAELEKYLKSV